MSFPRETRHQPMGCSLSTPSAASPQQFYTADTPQTQSDTVISIHQLPPEVLVRIIHRVIRTGQQPIRRLSRLTSICRRWHEVIYETQSLWALFSSLESPKGLGEAVARSGLYPASICIDEREKNALQPTSWLGRVAELQKQLPRCRSAKIVLATAHSHYSKPHIFAENLETPLLESLSVRLQPSDDSPWYSGLRTILPPRADKLRYLALRGVKVPWGAPILSGLRSLHIQQPSNGITFDNLWDLLQSNRELRTLAIAATGFITFVRKSTTFNPTPLILDRLRYLHLKNVPPNFASDLLPLIHAPSCEDFRLILMGEAGDQQPSTLTILQTTLHFLPSRILPTHNSRAPVKVDVRFMDLGFQARVFVGDDQKCSCFDIRLRVADVEESLRWAKDHLLPELRDPKVSMWLSPRKTPHKGLPVSSFVEASPNIYRLDVNLLNHVRDIIPMLSPPPTTLPMLRHLAFEARCDIQALAAMVQNRYQQNAETSSSGKVLPTRLEMLNVGPKGRQEDDAWDAALADLRLILGSAVHTRSFPRDR